MDSHFIWIPPSASAKHIQLHGFCVRTTFFDIAYDPNNNEMYVTNLLSHTVSVIGKASLNLHHHQTIASVAMSSPDNSSRQITAYILVVRDL